MLSIRAVSRTLGRLPVLSQVTLDVMEGEILCLLGASGSGKTTLLRIIAGLEAVDEGDLLLEGKSIRDVPVHMRNFGLMFQDFALFPHLTVEDNVAFGLKMQQQPRPHVLERIHEVLSLVGMTGFEKRDVASLSGGERQRVALARSLAPHPRLLMLDEPLGSLDATLREQLARDLRRVIKEIGQTAIYVTHDQREAFAVADRIALLHQGKIEQVSDPFQMFHRPASVYAARFLGLTNLFPVISRTSGELATQIGRFQSDVDADVLLVHPNGITVTDQTTAYRAAIISMEFAGAAYEMTVAMGSGELLSFSLPASRGRDLRVGQEINLMVDEDFLVWLKE